MESYREKVKTLICILRMTRDGKQNDKCDVKMLFDYIVENFKIPNYQAAIDEIKSSKLFDYEHYGNVEDLYTGDLDIVINACMNISEDVLPIYVVRYMMGILRVRCNMPPSYYIFHGRYGSIIIDI